MQFTLSTLVTLFAAATVVAAAPAEKSKRNFSGSCNGTSCKIGLINYGCSSGSCVGPNGGDGAYCQVADSGSLAQGPYECPSV